MNYPQRAYETFKRLSPESNFKELFDFIYRVLKRIDDPVDRARKSHHYINSFTNEVLENPVAQKFLSCKKGCSACCHTQVSVNRDEAKLLAKRVVDDQIDIDLKKLYIQGNVENCSKSWFQLPYEVRGCVFLDKSGSCSVYEDRPAVCRTNNVFSDPRMCDTKDGVEKPIRLLNTDKADLAVIASYNAAEEAGTLPHMLWQELSRDIPKKVTKKIAKKVRKKISQINLDKVKKDLSKFFEV